jgi:hypothetical protein
LGGCAGVVQSPLDGDFAGWAVQIEYTGRPDAGRYVLPKSRQETRRFYRIASSHERHEAHCHVAQEKHIMLTRGKHLRMSHAAQTSRQPSIALSAEPLAATSQRYEAPHPPRPVSCQYHSMHWTRPNPSTKTSMRSFLRFPKAPNEQRMSGRLPRKGYVPHSAEPPPGTSLTSQRSFVKPSISPGLRTQLQYKT